MSLIGASSAFVDALSLLLWSFLQRQSDGELRDCINLIWHNSKKDTDRACIWNDSSSNILYSWLAVFLSHHGPIHGCSITFLRTLIANFHNVKFRYYSGQALKVSKQGNTIWSTGVKGSLRSLNEFIPIVQMKPLLKGTKTLFVAAVGKQGHTIRTTQAAKAITSYSSFPWELQEQIVRCSNNSLACDHRTHT